MNRTSNAASSMGGGGIVKMSPAGCSMPGWAAPGPRARASSDARPLVGEPDFLAILPRHGDIIADDLRARTALLELQAHGVARRLVHLGHDLHEIFRDTLLPDATVSILGELDDSLDHQSIDGVQTIEEAI